MHYTVRDYKTGVIRWRGMSEGTCAQYWEPGTVYGKGETQLDADLQAAVRMGEARQEGEQ